MPFKLGLLVTAAAIVGLSQVASAADLPAKAPIYKALPAPVFDWTGFYVGGYVGVAASQSRSLDPTGAVAGVLEHTGYGFTGGGTAGYNWQLGNALFGNKWVVGVEGDIGYFDASRHVTDFGDPTLAYNNNTSWLATARGRIGWADGPNFGYITGGYAAVSLKDSNIDPTTGFEVSNDRIRSGYAVGTGTETMLGGGWSAKAESLYVDVGRGQTLLNTSNGFAVQTDRNRYQTQRFGLNYSFGAKTGPLPQTNWNGFYLGAVAGTSLASVRTTDPTGGTSGEIGNNGTGFFGGGQAGYNVMLGPRVLVGIEGDFSYFSSKHTNQNYGATTAFTGFDASWLATARARVGYSTGPAVLYATGGGAWVNLTENVFTGAGVSSASKTLGGWAVGGGIETVFSGNWSMKSEYLLVDVGHLDTVVVGANTSSADHTFHLFRTALVYRFSGNPLSGGF
jgi:outer membrane immunogenic protein